MNARRNEIVLVGPSRDLHFGEIIRQAVEARGLTQREFATKLGVKQPRVAEIFTQVSITEALLDRCMVALGCELEVKVVDLRPRNVVEFTPEEWNKLSRLAEARKTTPERCLRDFIETCEPGGSGWKYPGGDAS